MTDPINYTSAFADLPSPIQSFSQGVQAGGMLNDQQFKNQQQQFAMGQMQNQAQVMRNLISNPNAGAQDYSNAMLVVPGMKDQLKQAWDTKNTAQQQSELSNLSQWSSAIQNGHPELASSMMRQRADAIDASNNGQPTQESNMLRTRADITDAHPQFGNFMIKSLIMGHPDGSKLVDNLAKMGGEQRAEDQAPADLLKKQADASKAVSEATVENQTVPAKVQKASLDNANISSEIQNRADKLGLDRDKLTSDMQVKLTELARKPGAVDLSPAAEGLVNDSAQGAVLSRQQASQLNDLANQFQTADPTSGAIAHPWEFIKSTMGDQDYVSNLRKEYNRVRTSQAIGSLKGVGRITDKEMSAAMGGFPSDTANPDQIATFLRGMAKMQQFSAQVDDAKSEWMTSVGSLGKTARDIEVNGVHVPAGTNFQDFVTHKVKIPSAATQPPVPSGNAKQRLLQTYGGGSNTGGASGDY